MHVRIGTRGRKTHLIYVNHYTIHDLSLERLEDNSAVAGDELSLTAARHDQALANVENGDNSNDVAKFARAGAFDIGVELGLKELEHARAEVRGVEVNGVRELFLRSVSIQRT